MTYQMTYHVGSPRVPSEAGMHWIMQQFDVIMGNRRLTNDGPYVRELETAMADFLGVKHCIAVNNATTGLMIVAKALELTGEVIMPSMSFVATAHAFEWIGLRPVFAEIDPVTHHISANDVRKRITKKTTAIIGVHLWGDACNVRMLKQVAFDFGIKLIFDAAQAVGTETRGEGVAHFGDASVFSLHATKIINSLEGGIIATNDEIIAAQCRLLRNFGFNGEDNVVSRGINGKMHEMTAVVALEGLRGFDQARADNLAVYRQYKKELAGLPEIEVYPHLPGSNLQYNVIRVGGNKRDSIWQALNDQDILCRRYFYPGIHLTRPYNEGVHYGALPVTEKVLSEVLVLPAGGGLTEEDVVKICVALRREVEAWQ